MKPPRGLSAEEAALWARVAATVEPFAGKESPPLGEVAAAPRQAGRPAARDKLPEGQRLTEGERHRTTTPKPVAPRPLHHASRGSPPPEGENRVTPNPRLDSHWERRLRAGTLAPDFTLDLHEHSLDAAYQRLLGGLDIARETGARVVLVIAGRERPAPAADRSGQRGAIRAKLLDWLAASRHAPAIAAIRKAQRRHGGEGALYIVLRRGRS